MRAIERYADAGILHYPLVPRSFIGGTFLSHEFVGSRLSLLNRARQRKLCLVTSRLRVPLSQALSPLGGARGPDAKGHLQSQLSNQVMLRSDPVW